MITINKPELSAKSKLIVFVKMFKNVQMEGV